MAGRFSLIAVFLYAFQLSIAFFNSINLFGIGNLPYSKSVSVAGLGAGINVVSCNIGGLNVPFGCSSILLVGGALVSSILFFGAWAFAMSLWLGFYGSGMVVLHYTLTNILGLTLEGAAVIDLVVLSTFAADMIYMYSWRDPSGG